MSRRVVTLGLLCLLGLVEVAGQQVAAPARGPAVGEDATCVSCHQQANSYTHTAHRATSSLATESALAPLLAAAGSRLQITGAPLPTLAFVMNKKDGRFTETAESGWGDDLARASEPIDVIVGSDKRGQTFLYWSGNRLFELPVSFWKDGHRWINSPGYVDGTADFKRPVQAGCLECHATAITSLPVDATANSFVRASLVPGIGCRTCHGPGEAHVTAEIAAAVSHTPLTETAILNPAHFPRERQMDLCAVCHSGIQRVALAPAFSYVPGAPLADYFKPLPSAAEDRPDVHGNQVGLLERSRCFVGSTKMTCSTCHDVHTVGQPVETYAARCLTCHQWQTCGEAHRLGASIQTKCIGCHMPLQQTSAIVSVTAEKQVQATMRTHWIKVYAPEAGPVQRLREKSLR